MRKYVIAAFLIVNVGLLSTIYFVRQRAAELKTEKVEKKSAPVAAVPVVTPEKVEPPSSGDSIVLPDIFATGVTPPPAPFPIPFQTGTPGVSTASTTTKLRREGARLTNLLGTIRRRGNRYELMPADGSLPFILLENQLLQRVDVALQGAPIGGSQFRLNGMITEYLGENYMLLQWIIQEPASSPPAP